MGCETMSTVRELRALFLNLRNNGKYQRRPREVLFRCEDNKGLTIKEIIGFCEDRLDISRCICQVVELEVQDVSCGHHRTQPQVWHFIEAIGKWAVKEKDEVAVEYLLDLLSRVGPYSRTRIFYYLLKVELTDPAQQIVLEYFQNKLENAGLVLEAKEYIIKEGRWFHRS